MTQNHNNLQREFHSPSHGPVSVDEVVQFMTSFQAEQPQREYRLLIGTDSLAGAGNKALLVTALVLHRVGNGGVYFWCRQQFNHLATLRDRMYQEALTSIETAQWLLERPHVRELLKGDIEIHVDVGHNGPTRTMIREIVGMVTANGFLVRTKPEAVAASKIADRHTVVLF